MRSSSSLENTPNPFWIAVDRSSICYEMRAALPCKAPRCASSLGCRIRLRLASVSRFGMNVSIALFLIIANVIAGRAQTRAQNGELVVATVNGLSITERQVDEAATKQIFSLQQQLYAIRKIALDNLIIRKLLENEAQRRKVSVDELKGQMMSGPVEISTMQVEELYRQNASVFAMMSPDEAKEKLRLGSGRPGAPEKVSRGTRAIP